MTSVCIVCSPFSDLSLRSYDKPFTWVLSCGLDEALSICAQVIVVEGKYIMSTELALKDMMNELVHSNLLFRNPAWSRSSATGRCIWQASRKM